VKPMGLFANRLSMRQPSMNQSDMMMISTD
jgi:hypothetical protein